MMVLVSFVFFRAVATKVASNCCGGGLSGSHCREPCRTVFGGSQARFILGFWYCVRLVFAYRFPLFFHESALTNPLACISLKVLTAE